MRLLVLLRAVSASLLLLGGACLAQDLDSLRALGQVDNEEPLRAVLKREPAPGMSALQLAEFYQAQAVAARRLGDRIAQERILRRWIKDVPNNMGPRRSLFGVLVATDKRAEGLALGESVLRDEVSSFYKVRLSSALAIQYLNSGNLNRARELLIAAEKMIAGNFNRENMGAAQAFWTNHAKLVFLRRNAAFQIGCNSMPRQWSNVTLRITTASSRWRLRTW